MLGALVSNLVRLVAMPAVMAQRAFAVPRGSWVVAKLHGHVTELERPYQRWLRPVRPPPSVAVLRLFAEAAAGDPDVAGVLFRIEDLQCGWATAVSLRDLISKLRASGKQVVAWLPEGGGTRELFIAAACDRIYTTPQASLAPLGVAAGATFLRGLLARGGIEAEVYARREYKSAAETFVRDGFSEPNRAQLSALLDRFHAELVRSLGGRGLDEARAREVIDRGPYRPTDAVAAGLIDGTAYEDDLPLKLDGGKKVKLVPAAIYVRLALAMRLRPLIAPRYVGVVEVRGPIVSRARMAFGSVAAADRIVGALRVARASRQIGAVVLYVDTSGGSALASDVIAREVDRLKEKKPVVAYFSDVAASGGYYVGALANEIVAQPTTVTGSIGVIAMRFVARGALEKLGLTHEVIRRGERADLMSPYRRWDEGDRAAFEREIDGFYNDFVGVVARGRKRGPEAIEPLARGRVWSGADAFDAGLVDHLGGFEVAVRRARSLGEGRFDEDPVFIPPPRVMPDPPEPPQALQPLVSLLGAEGAADLLNLAVAAPHEHLFAYEELGSLGLVSGR